jgi:hypothetical protein
MMIDKQGCAILLAAAAFFFLALYGALALFGEVAPK